MTPEKRLITPHEAAVYIPPFREFVGSYELRRLLEGWLKQDITHDANLLVEGDPGTGKTSILIAYLRDKFKNPFLFWEGYDPQWYDGSHPARRYKSLPEFREHQCGGRIYFKQFEGATDTEGSMRSKLQEALYYVGYEHCVALVDELGECFFRGHDEMLRPMLTDPGVTTFATAQNFHSKRRSDTAMEEAHRLTALLRRFPYRIPTEPPTDQDHCKLLAFLVNEWSIKVDSPSTIRKLVEKSCGVVGHSKRILVRAIAEPDRKLTARLVDDDDMNPA